MSDCGPTLAADASLSRADAASAVNAVFSAIADALAGGRHCHHRGIRDVLDSEPRRSARAQPEDRTDHRHRALPGARIQGGQVTARRRQPVTHASTGGPMPGSACARRRHIARGSLTRHRDDATAPACAGDEERSLSMRLPRSLRCVLHPRLRSGQDTLPIGHSPRPPALPPQSRATYIAGTIITSRNATPSPLCGPSTESRDSRETGRHSGSALPGCTRVSPATGTLCGSHHRSALCQETLRSAHLCAQV